jgi:hypothetical protein
MKTPEEIYNERKNRVWRAIQLKEPDRVPFLPFQHFFPAKYAGITNEEAMHNYDKLASAWQMAIIDFEPDMYSNPFFNIALGPLLGILDFKLLIWPGQVLPPTSPYQFIEKEYMLAEEYDDFLFDPTDYIQRVYLPRTYGALEPLTLLPSTPSLLYTRFLPSTGILRHPEVAMAVQSLLKASEEAEKMLAKSRAFVQEMKSLGFPTQFGAIAFSPFDYFGDVLRGTRGVMLDMYRHPDKLLAALDKMTVYVIRGVLGQVKATGESIVYIPLHKCIDGFMSSDHFNTFYWPSLRKVMLSLIENGLTPCPFWEGKCDSRLETIKDIPKGKAVYMFEQTDLVRAKQILGDTVCIRGNVPASMLCTATPQEITDYCRTLFAKVGKGGDLSSTGVLVYPMRQDPKMSMQWPTL